METICVECKGEGYFSDVRGEDWTECEKYLGEGTVA